MELIPSFTISQIKLDSLKKGRPYEAVIYSPDTTIQTRTKVKLERRQVTANTVLTIDLGKNGAYTMEINPVK